MIEIEEFREEPPGRPTIATFTAYMPGGRFRIRRIRLLKLKNGSYKVAMPSYKENPDALPPEKPIFKAYVEFSPEKQKEFETKVLESLRPFLKLP